ncbi:MAG TPA: glycosyltransferase family 39 protein, partial [Solirubrobacteraceae bacterium]|nr:glycosyltransferase family 39 protein [Solirubrobacteraceae bacterium]
RAGPCPRAGLMAAVTGAGRRAASACRLGGTARLEVGGLAAGALVAVAFWWLVPTFPNYDAYFHLVWGRELLGGRAPTFEAYAAPTQHPLYLVVAALLSLLGAGADRALVLLTMLCLVALTWATFRLARALFGSWSALLAALFVGSSFAFLLYAVRAYVDVPFLALVIGAAAWEAEAARREGGVGGRAGPMALLATAGLLRPEAWVLGGLYALLSLPGRPNRRRGALLALAAAPPLLWAAVDLAVTGDPLHSLKATNDLADELNRPRGLAEVPGAFVSFVADVARPPVALAGVLGVGLAVARLGWRPLAVPLGLAGAGLVTFVGTGLAGLSILPRYLTVPVIALSLFAGYAIAGFTTLPPGHRWRRRWRRAASGAALLGLAFLVWKLPSFARLEQELAFVGGMHQDHAALLATPRVRAAVACGPISFPNYRLVPETRWRLGLPAAAVAARSDARPGRGVAVFFAGRRALERYGFADGASPATNAPDPGFSRLARRGSLAAYAACPADRPPAR